MNHTTPSSINHLFVYGTLRKQLAGVMATAEMARFMQNLTAIGEGSLPGELYDLGPYPGGIVGPDFSTIIHGEVYALIDPIADIAALDVYEGFIPGELEASLFARVQAEVTLSNGDFMSCWLYVYNDWVSQGQLIANGDYLKWLTQEKKLFSEQQATRNS